MVFLDRFYVYEIYVFVFDIIFDFEKGFYMNEFFKVIEGYVLDIFILKGSYFN